MHQLVGLTPEIIIRTPRNQLEEKLEKIPSNRCVMSTVALIEVTVLVVSTKQFSVAVSHWESSVVTPDQ